MQSTGEVIGIHDGPARGAGQGARSAPSLVPPRPGADGALALLSIADRDKAAPAAGWPPPWRRPAIGSPRRPGRGPPWPRPASTREPVAKLGEAADEALGEVPILDLIASGDVRLVVNTPTPRSGAVRDAAEIRLAATAEGILCLTAMETAVAAAEALDPSIAGRLAEVRSLDEWVPRIGGVAVGAGR